MRLLADPKSSASLRVLCYLDHKGREIPFAPVSLRAGEHAAEAYVALNPSRAVPALDLGEGRVIGQSLAILEYLEDLWPERPLMPVDRVQRAQVRNLCGLVAADIHPLTNMRVRQEVERLGGAEASAAWNRRWTQVGLDALEAWVARDGGLCAVGDELTLADFFVVPVLFNAGRLGVDLQPWTQLAALYARSLPLPGFARLR